MTLLAWCSRALVRVPISGRSVLLAVPTVWLLLFFVLPFGVMLYISLVNQGDSATAFVSLWDEGLNIKTANYSSIFVGDDGSWFSTIYVRAYVQSVSYALVATLGCLVIGYPFAYVVARASPRRRSLLLVLIMLPFWSSFLLRIYAWKGLLAKYGLLNNLMMALGIVTEPVTMLYSDFAIVVGMIYVYLPFMVLPIYASLVRLDNRLLEAAYDLGASPQRAFWHITVPLSRPGIMAGSMLVFVPCVGEYVIPTLLGGVDNLMIGRVVWDEMFVGNNWPRANALAVVMLLLIMVPLMLYFRNQRRL